MRAIALVLVAGSMALAADRAPSRDERPITAEDRDHWAFRPPSRPAVPSTKRTGWARNPVDAFVLKGLEEVGLGPAPEASRESLIRRATFDLTGLPPSPEEVDAFLKDGEPGAFGRVVDRLLASPHYGERWAQHWLDLARYADTDGFEFDQARPDAWRYRDWVVGALNRDMPYDRFIRLQLAGDEVMPGDPSAFVATGFNRGYPDMVDLNDQGLRRQNALNDITETTALAFLGLTLGCARCHDHKYDPIRQSDFYKLQAFFAPARFRDDFPIGVEGSAPAGKARGIDEVGGPSPTTYLLLRGEYSERGPVVEPSAPAVLMAAGAGRFAVEAGPRSSGRRRALADWLASPSNPLTARVMVNRLWQAHFGRGIVATPSDFGTQGAAPTHPELLDWLATELVARGWGLKAIHRLIVTSAAYRQDSRASTASAEADPENEYLSHQNRKRLDGEAIRDALLAASGRLNPALGGPCVFPELPAELTKLSGKGAVWPVSPRAEDRDRRSLYVFIRRNLRYPFFEVFDRPDTNASCPRRPVSTIAPQALTLLNGKLARDSAAAMAARVARESSTEAGRVERAYRLALGREPVEAERDLARSFLGGGGPEAFEDFCLALLNLNEFVYLD